MQGLHNLCVVFVERGQLGQAEKCLQAAHQLAPNEDYIVRHLRIVQQRLRRPEGEAEHYEQTTEPVVEEPQVAHDKDEVSVS